MVNIVARSTFSATARVDLAHWHELDAATVWCCSMWDLHRKKFRKPADVSKQEAVFEFADQTHAIEFKLRFG